MLSHPSLADSRCSSPVSCRLRLADNEEEVALARIVALGVLTAVLAFSEDPVAALTHRMERGEVQLPFASPYGFLPALLKELRIPVESQISVFSKTSIQSLRIEPANPRVLYFNDSVAVGFVHGGFLELAAQDPGHGIHYYALSQFPGEKPVPRQDCLRCHTLGATQFRSVEAGLGGVASNEIDADSRTPFTELWGGWYVTGMTPSGHLGNMLILDSEKHPITPVLNSKVALTTTSDPVALLVFGHQMRVWNLLAHPDKPEELADALLFADESPLPGPVHGDSGFAEKFAGQGPRDHSGRSLREFDLQTHLMRFRCSYIIYSEAFDALPAATKDAVYRRMSAVLNSSQFDARERAAIVEILRDTKRDLPEWFGSAK